MHLVNVFAEDARLAAEDVRLSAEDAILLSWAEVCGLGVNSTMFLTAT